MHFLFGALAQLGERNTGSVEVSGSIPLGSTKNQSLVRKCGGFLVLDRVIRNRAMLETCWGKLSQHYR
jgi:hypothetical protein